MIAFATTLANSHVIYLRIVIPISFILVVVVVAFSPFMKDIEDHISWIFSLNHENSPYYFKSRS